MIKYFKTINKWARQSQNKLFETNDRKMKHRENTSIDVSNLPIYDPAVTFYTYNTEAFSLGFWNKVPIVSLNDYIVQVLTRKHIVINYPSEQWEI